MKTTGFAFLGFLVTLAAADAVQAKPEAVRLSYMGDAATTAGVAWSTYSGAVETTVQYGLSSTALTSQVVGKSATVSATLGAVSEATLLGLKPSTHYYYRVGGPKGGWSKVYHFRTGDPKSLHCGKTRFVVVGDGRAEKWEGDKGASHLWHPLLADARKHAPHFALHGGDIVYDGNRQKQWYNYLKATAPSSPYLPIMYALGNHDDGPGEGDTANYNKVFNLPRSEQAVGGSGTEDFYFFTIGNVLVASVSTESFSSGSPKFGNQAKWLDKVLTQNPRKWKIVILHRPIYTYQIKILGQAINHPSNEAGHNAAFVPIFNKHHVDIVFQSHNHFYERYAPSKCTNGGSTKACKVSGYDKGTVYVTTGGGGAFPISCPFLCPGKTDSTRVKASSDHHYVLVDITNHKLSYKAINNKGKTLDSMTITKGHPTPDPCAKPPTPDLGPLPPDGGSIPDLAPPPPDMAQTADTVVPRQDGTQPPADQKPPAKDLKQPPKPDQKAAPKPDQKAAPQKDQKVAPKKDQGKVTPPTTDADSGCNCNTAGSGPGPLSLGLMLVSFIFVQRRRRS